MTKLVTDAFIRRLAQLFILSIGVAILAICACFVVVATQYKLYGWVMGEDDWKYLFVQIISFPFDSSLGTFITGLSAIIPTMLAAVCFSVDSGVVPPKAGKDLNHVGHLFVLTLAMGIAFSVVAIFLVGTLDLSTVFPDSVKTSAPTQLRALFGAFLAIQGAYLTQLVKDKD